MAARQQVPDINEAWTREQLDRNLGRVLNPAVCYRAWDALKKPDSDFVQIASVLQGDPFIAAKVVGLANMLRRAGDPTIASVQRAVQVLGVRSVQTLIAAVMLTGPLMSMDPKVPHRVDLWRWVFGCAAAGDYLGRAHAQNDVKARGQQYLVTGLLLGLGSLVLYAGLGPTYGEVLGSTLRPLRLALREQRALGVTHHDVTVWALETMHCPGAMSEPARALIAQRDDEAGLWARAIEVLGARAVGLESAKAEVWLADALPHLGFAAESLVDEALPVMRARVRELTRVYGIDLGNWQQQETRQEVMIAAARSMESMLVESLAAPPSSPPAASNGSSERGAAPQHRPLIDPLTGLLTRRGWEAHLRDSVPETSDPLALVLVDLDRFRAFNERFGQPDGDRALSVVATLLRSTQAEPVLVARIGHDEFAGLYRVADAAGLQALMQEVRHLLAQPQAAVADTNLTACVAAAPTSGRQLHTDAVAILERVEAELGRARTDGPDCAIVARV